MIPNEWIAKYPKRLVGPVTDFVKGQPPHDAAAFPLSLKNGAKQKIKRKSALNWPQKLEIRERCGQR